MPDRVLLILQNVCSHKISFERFSANSLPPPNVAPRHSSAHDSPHQPIQVPAHTYTTYPMPRAPDTRMPRTASSSPPVIEQRSGTMQMPDPHNNIPPAPGPYSNYNSQAQGMSDSPSQRGGGMLCAGRNAPHGYRNRASVPYSKRIHALSSCLFDLSREPR